MFGAVGEEAGSKRTYSLGYWPAGVRCTSLLLGAATSETVTVYPPRRYGCVASLAAACSVRHSQASSGIRKVTDIYALRRWLARLSSVRLVPAAIPIATNCAR